MNNELDTILIKVASRCNINCTYCYVYNMGDDNWSSMEKLISKETVDAICDSLSSLVEYQEKKFSIVLHGGEPLLLGVKKLTYLLKSLRTILPNSYPIGIQSNGILITKEILDICALYQVSVAVSIDGPENIHNKFRKNHRGDGTFTSVLQGIKELKSHPDARFLNAGLLAVIDPCSNPKEVYSFFKAIEAPSVDFLYKDGNHSNLPVHKTSVDSTEYGQWMIDLLQVYLSDSDPIPIRVLDDMLKVLLGGIVSKEGLGVTDFGIIIIDTDGTIMKNDTLKSSYNGADKFANSFNIKERNLLTFLSSNQFLEYRQSQKPTCDKCLNCPVLNICGGGMTLHRWQKESGFNNPSIYCSDQLLLINNMRAGLEQFDLSYE
jgi:uncharacterized protein